jgi:hypothetical protein
MDRISFEKERRGGFDARCWSYNFELPSLPPYSKIVIFEED